MSPPSWRLKSYAVQALALVISALLLVACVLIGDSPWIWAAALTLALAIHGGAWWLRQRLAPGAGQHLTPREWEELRGALEDAPVLSVMHLFTVDRAQLEQFRYIPTLERYLWGCLSEEPPDPERLVRAAFLLHTFGEDLTPYQRAIHAVPDPIVRAYLNDLIAEPGSLRHRQHLRQCASALPQLMERLGRPADASGEDPGQEAAWRLFLFGELARDSLHQGLEHSEPQVREASIALLAMQGEWPTRHKDLMRRINHDPHPAVRRAALEILAAGEQPPRFRAILQSLAADPELGARSIELLREME
ncbi:MAG: hypothetical protein CMH57_13435 [Myxococcales bacterium]|nr:hypothetical protein [Myxococcales bacterium]